MNRLQRTWHNILPSSDCRADWLNMLSQAWSVSYFMNPQWLSPRHSHLHQSSKRLHQQLSCCWSSTCIAEVALRHIYIKEGIQNKKSKLSENRGKQLHKLAGDCKQSTITDLRVKHAKEHAIMKIPLPSTHPKKPEQVSGASFSPRFSSKMKNHL